jgi:hypothetical protein
MGKFKDNIPGEAGWQQQKFQKKSYNDHQYHDPIYSSFVFLIDWYGSPLFNGLAEEFLRNTLGDVKRADQLHRFTLNLQKLIMEMPWAFQELEGMENVFKFDELKKNYRGGDDAVISIKCLESTDLIITGLMDAYRNIAFDIERWCEVLPHNMTYFNCNIIVTDARRFHEQKVDTRKAQTNDFKDDERTYIKTNQGIAATSKAHFMVSLIKCNFKSDSGTEIFAGLNNAEPKLAEGSSIKFGYHIIEYYSKQYLNAFEGTLASNMIAEANQGPQPGQENPEQQASYGDTVSGKAENGNATNVDGDPIKVNKQGSSLDRVTGFGEDLTKAPLNIDKMDNFGKDLTKDPLNIDKMDNFGESPLDKLEEKAASILDAVDGYPGRLKNSLGASGKGLVNRFISDQFAKLLLGNVYGINTLSTIQDAIAAGNINGIINLINETSSKDDGDGVIGNINNMSPLPEIALSRNNVYSRRSPGEIPLESEKAYDPAPPEEDSQLGSI